MRLFFCLYLGLALVLGLFYPSWASQTLLPHDICPDTVKQGQTLEILIPNDFFQAVFKNEQEQGLKFKNITYPLFEIKKEEKTDNSTKEENIYRRALVAIPANLDPALYTLTLGDLKKEIRVISSNFPIQNIHLPHSKDTFKSSPGEEEAVDKAKSTLSLEQYWDSKFIRPCKSRVSASFGLKRRVNGRLLKDYFHSGLDFAAASGSPVLACQNGKVRLAHYGWKLHGNTVCIDHGQGVLSFYIHLNKIFVHEGDVVKAGQKIATVGSTGRANGPHLHFSIYVNKEATNPNDWFNKYF